MSSPSLAWWPSTDIVLSHSSPARIGTLASAADFTPGCRAQAVEQLLVEAARALVVVAAERGRQLERDQVVEWPRRCRWSCRFCRLRTNRPAPNSSRKLSATCAATRPLRRKSVPARAGHRADGVLERAPGIRPAGAQRRQQAEHHAGDQRQREREREDAQVGRRAGPAAAGRRSGTKREQHARERRRPPPGPPTPPANDSSRLSASSWRTSCPREAPSDRRTAISRCRAKPRAISRLATFAQAISSTRPTMHISTISAVREVVAQRRVADVGAARRRAGPS